MGCSVDIVSNVKAVGSFQFWNNRNLFCYSYIANILLIFLIIIAGCLIMFFIIISHPLRHILNFLAQMSLYHWFSLLNIFSLYFAAGLELNYGKKMSQSHMHIQHRNVKYIIL